MKIYIMTDMEGVCGVVDHDNWVVPEGRYYEEGKRLLTLEVNAAVEGFFAAGADEALVLDGHGFGGVNQTLLDKRTKYLRMSPGRFPFEFDNTFDALVFIGQHAKAGSEYAHIAHTGWFDALDCSINGVSVGEFGYMSMLAASMGVPTILACGDEALVKEAEQLVKGIVAVGTKKGTTTGSGDECTTEEYKARNLSAVHLHPEVARDLIREAANKSLSQLKEDKQSFPLLDVKPPYEMINKFRPSADKAAREHVARGESIAYVLNNWG